MGKFPQTEGEKYPKKDAFSPCRFFKCFDVCNINWPIEGQKRKFQLPDLPETFQNKFSTLKVMKNFLFSVLLLSAISASSQKTQPVVRRCGNDFSNYGLNGATHSSALDSAGQWHNDYQEFILNKIVSEKVSPTSEAFNDFFKNATIAFFETKGINASHTPFSNSFDPSDRRVYTRDDVSRDGQSILTDLDGLAHSNTSPDEFRRLALQLKNRALSLSDESEVFKVGLSVTVAMYSNAYWSSNASRWENILRGESSYDKSSNNDSGGETQKKVRIGLGQLGAADVSGAVAGAWSGIVAGPGGSLAGGVLGSATSSASNLLGQIFTSFAPSWW